MLRGLAAGLMVANHVAVRRPYPTASGPIEVASFVGSFAPVLFFFLTGLGHGVLADCYPDRCCLLFVPFAALA
jgi:hypothetical protein